MLGVQCLLVDRAGKPSTGHTASSVCTILTPLPCFQYNNEDFALHLKSHHSIVVIAMEVVTDTINQATSYISQQSSPRLAAASALATTTLVAAWVLSDYHAWTSFGTGGTPPTWSGYWRMTKMRVNHALSGPDLRDASSLDANQGPRYLPDAFEQSPRQTPRPRIVSRTMPQRQIPLKKSEMGDGVRARVDGLCATFALKYDDLVYLAPSKTEGLAADAIYAKDVESLNPAVKHPKNKILQGEVGHAHPADASLHVWLSEGDAKRVVEGGWGERFPLSFVDKGWVMVYAPTTMAEMEVVESIMRAAIGWVCGQSVS